MCLLCVIMLLLLFVCFVFVGGQLVKTRGNCRLEQDPSVEYFCIVQGPFDGIRACEASEPSGTTAVPQCRKPNYYDAQPLSHMKCFDGYWNQVARCSPECGRVTSDGIGLVVGGQRVKRGELPWHAGIYRKTTQPYTQICGGSLLSSNVVLSAAHCFWGQEQQLPALQFAVAVGKLYRPWDDPNDEAQNSDVKMIHCPPRYQGAMANHQDDIAVVMTTKAFQFRNHIRPVCLSFDDIFEKQQLNSGNNGKVAGWGLTAADGKPSAVLQVADLPYVEVGTCIKNSAPDFREYITSDKICAGTLSSNSALCMGDSGGGLVFPALVRGIERYYLRGVVSTAATSEHACNVNTYTAFTSITKHEHFIKEFWSETAQFRCQDGSIITAANHCDGTKECSDGSDESEWACAGKRCSDYLFRCKYGACVDYGARCNGVLDCADGSDEVSDMCAELGMNPVIIVDTFSTPKPSRRVSLRVLGSACQHRGINGTCQKAQFCPTYAVLAKHQIQTEVTECSRNGNEMVICCTDCQIENANNAAVTPDGILWKTGGKRKIYDKCVEYAATLPYRCKDGKKVTPRKVFDEEKHCHWLDVSVAAEASPVKKRVHFPNLALLGYKRNARAQLSWSCQALIISERFLLTSARCGTDTYNGLLTAVAVGVDKRPPIADPESDAPLPPPPATWQIYKVKSITVHPGYRDPTKQYYNDLALVETESKMTFSENVLPMCLSEQATILDTVHSHILGIQHDTDNKEVQLQQENEKECSSLNGEFLCYKALDAAKYGYHFVVQACKGSNGHPIFVPGSVPCVGAAVGVTSFGQPCSKSFINMPTEYVRLYLHLPWIQSVVWP